MSRSGTAEQLQERRFRAMALLKEGYSQTDVARCLGVAPSAVCQWKKAYAEGGKEALVANPHPGPTPKLSAKQGERLLKYLQQGPSKHGWKTQLWTLPRIAELIERKFGEHYDQSGVWRLMRRLDWSCQKPERRARERDPDAIEQWRKKEWPRLKKRAT
jgi:transposase